MSDLIKHQSEKWDMDISLEDLLRENKECMVDRNYKAHKYDYCFHGYCMYLKHPKGEGYSLMIGIYEDGFTYLGDGCGTENFPMENTLEIIKEMALYRDWIVQKERNKGKLLTKGIDYDELC